MKYLLAILGLGIACAVWMGIQLWTGSKSKKDRWRGGGGCGGHAILFALFLSVFGCKHETELTQSTQQIMGTPITVTAPAQYHQVVFDIFRQVDNDMSEWKQYSPLTRVNLYAGKEPVEVPTDLLQTVQRSLEIAALTSGAFDPTWASLWKLWKFDGSNVIPSKEQVGELLPLVDWTSVLIDEKDNTMYLPNSNSMIGLGGIAKGVALDAASDALVTQGLKDFMITAGGQVLVHGSKNGQPWRVGIRDPEKEQTDYFAVLELTDTCVSTSGNYEKFFMKDGIRYHHIIDPKTGYPARGVQSVTVISQDATLADALSTALFVMGVKDGITLIESVSNVEALFIDDNNVIHQSSGFTFSSLF